MSTPGPPPAPSRSDLEIVRVVGAAILRPGECLVTQRSELMAEPLKWEFPGGKVESGETPESALAREIREELDLVIEIGRHLGSGAHVDHDRRIELEVFTAEIVSGKIHLREHHRHGWFAASRIPALDWAAADRPILPALVRLLRQPPDAIQQ
ncbi:MAG: (deoxy)nucleoside triphosphate pyrophosphohydrolase [Thermoanaerobaculia bacterium]